MKKRIMAILVIAMMLGVFGLAGCSDNEDPVARIERHTGMALSMEKEQEYYYYDQDFQGSFRLYAIFKLQEEPKQFLDEYSFKNVTNEYIATQNDSHGYYSRIVPEEYYFSFENEHYLVRNNFVYSGGRAISMYFPDMQKLLFIIEIL